MYHVVHIRGLGYIVSAVANWLIFLMCVCRAGKTYMMLGVDDSPLNLGVIPTAIAWLYRLVDERRQTTGARFSVRVSAVEVTGRHETVKDLLANFTTGMSSQRPVSISQI